MRESALEPLEAITADDIVRFRSQMEFSRGGLAAALGAGVRTIEDWEAGRRQPPILLRLAFAALARQTGAWVAVPILGPGATHAEVDVHVRNLLADRGHSHVVDLEDLFERALRDGASPAETLLCARLMDAHDGYNRIEILEDWNSRTIKGWRTAMAFRPDGFALRPTIVVEAREEAIVRSLAVFVDKHRPGERLPAKVQCETGLIAQGYRVLSFSETDVLVNGETCAETIDTVISELVDEVLHEAGHVNSAWVRPDRRGELPRD
jgi:hypothetical protein